MAPAANGFLFATSGLTLSTNSKKRLIVSSGGTSTFSGDTTGVTITEVVGAYGQLFSVVDDLSNVLSSCQISLWSLDPEPISCQFSHQPCQELWS